jgi:tyrosinase
MTGFCPNGTGAPDCYAGPKWTPNDPMFFLHHAVGFNPSRSSLVSAINSLSLQMIDRLWSGWQLVAPQNALSFTGGSVQARETFAIYRTFPNGGPPFLHVSQTHRNDSYRY